MLSSPPDSAVQDEVGWAPAPHGTAWAQRLSLLPAGPHGCKTPAQRSQIQESGRCCPQWGRAPGTVGPRLVRLPPVSWLGDEVGLSDRAPASGWGGSYGP